MVWTWLSLNIAAISALFWLRRVPYVMMNGHTIFFPMRIFHLAVVPIFVAIAAMILIRVWLTNRQPRSVLSSPILWSTCVGLLVILDSNRDYPVSLTNSLSGRMIPFEKSCQTSETLVQEGEPNGGLLLLMEQIHLPSTPNPPFELRRAVGIHQACIALELAKRNIRLIVLEDLSLDPRSLDAKYDYKGPLFTEHMPSQLVDYRPAEFLHISEGGVLAYGRAGNGVQVHPAGGNEAWDRFQRIRRLEHQLSDGKDISGPERLRLEAERDRLTFSEREEDAAGQAAFWWGASGEERTLALVYGADHRFPANLFQKAFEKKPTVKRISWMNSPAMSGHRLRLEHNPVKELPIIRSAVGIPYYSLEYIDSLEGLLLALPKVLPAGETFPEKHLFEHVLRQSATKGLEKLVEKSAMSEGWAKVSEFISRQAEQFDGPFVQYKHRELSPAEAKGEVSREAILEERNPVRQLRLLESAQVVHYEAYSYAATREAQRVALPKLRARRGRLPLAQLLAILQAQAFDLSIKNMLFEMAQSYEGPFAIYGARPDR